MTFHLRKFILIISFCISINIVYHLVSYKPNFLPGYNYSNQQKSYNLTVKIFKQNKTHLENIVKDHKKYRLSTKGCKINDLPLYDDETKDLFKERYNNQTTYDCKKNIMVNFERYNETSIRLVSYETKYRPLCYYRSLKMGPKGDKSDFRYGKFVGPFVANDLNLADYEFVHILCYKRSLLNRQRIVDKDFDRKDPDLIHNEIIPLIPFVNKTSDSNVPNVLLLSIDSTSYLNFKRNFLRTETFLNKQKFFELRGYNKVGANTFPNMIPFLTGHNSNEFVSDEELKNIYFDDWPIVWKEFSNRGFVTAFVEDAPMYGLFHNGLLGFKSKPTDYQTRPFHMEILPEMQNKICYLDKTETERCLDFTLDFVRAMNKRKQKYFAFIAMVEMTHNMLEAGHYLDVPYYQLLSKLFDENLLENTVILFFSDHGMRYGSLKETHTGEYENRLPLMFIHLPENFNPRHIENLRQNQFRLTTHFDMHSTLIHLIRGEPDHNLPHGQSLFDSVISDERDCNSSSIPDMFCSCYEDTEVYNYDVINPRYTLPKIMDRINSLTINDRLICAEYEFVSINKLFNRSLTRNDSEFSLGDSLFYIIQIYVNPGMALFETLIRGFDQNTRFEIISDIIRINLYGKQSHCVNDKKLESYCYCNDLLS